MKLSWLFSHHYVLETRAVITLVQLFGHHSHTLSEVTRIASLCLHSALLVQITGGIFTDHAVLLASKQIQ